jgi:hypothetical protein
MTTTPMRVLPSLVIAADWSIDEKKRWMVRAERVDPGAYVVYTKPESEFDRIEGLFKPAVARPRRVAPR